MTGLAGRPPVSATEYPGISMARMASLVSPHRLDVVGQSGFRPALRVFGPQVETRQDDVSRLWIANRHIPLSGNAQCCQGAYEGGTVIVVSDGPDVLDDDSSGSQRLQYMTYMALFDGDLPVPVRDLSAPGTGVREIVIREEHGQKGVWEGLHDAISTHRVCVRGVSYGQMGFALKFDDQPGQFRGMSVEVLAHWGIGLTGPAPLIEEAPGEQSFGTSIVVDQSHIRGEGSIDAHAKQDRTPGNEAP